MLVPTAFVWTDVIEALTLVSVIFSARILEGLCAEGALECDLFNHLLQLVVGHGFFLELFATGWTAVRVHLKPLIDALRAKKFIAIVTAEALSHIE